MAAFLISKVINSLGKYQTFIFKKDGKPLTYNYINKTSYYFVDVTFLKERTITNRIDFITNDNIQEIYNFVSSISKKSIVYCKTTLTEFLELYHNTVEQNVSYPLLNPIFTMRDLCPHH